MEEIPKPARELVRELGTRARAAAHELVKTSPSARAHALMAIAEALEGATREILSANAKDLEAAREAGLTPASLDRLALDDSRLVAMAGSLRAVADLPDPVGEILRAWTRPNGLRLEKVRTPLGVVGIIYESRPNVTVDAAALCLKTGNATILRGGSESLLSNTALADAARQGLASAGLPADAVQLVHTPDRAIVTALAADDEALDVIVPRGGRSLIEAVVRHARVPVIKHYEGICAVYVDAHAEPDMAAAIVANAKCQRPGVCNAMETLLVHRSAADSFMDRVLEGLGAAGVEIRAEPDGMDLLRDRNYPHSRPATPEDFRTEFLDKIFAMKLVDSAEEAIAHINSHGSHHSDAIVTADSAVAERFLEEVDSAAVFWNASTRFTDGCEFGFGAEVGISTDKLHARGPMGLEELTTYKYLIRGEGQIRS